MTESIEAAQRAVAALLEGGVRQVVVAPGSRSAPLAYVLAAAEAAGAVELHVRIDERDAGFTALGMALSARAPVAVVTTSGTAVGNLLPAVMEANHAQVPLVVLSADRPAELRGTGANQTTDQTAMFGPAVRCEADIGAGEDPTEVVALALSAAAGGPGSAPSRMPGVPGPVQVNMAFRDPLVPADPISWPLPSAEKSAAPAGQAEDEGAAAFRRPAGRYRTVVIAGAGAGPAASAFAENLGQPLCAEPSSGARHGNAAVGPYRLLLPEFGGRIQRAVLFGRPTLSRQVSALLAGADVETAIYQPAPVAWYASGRRRERIVSNLQELAEFAGSGPDGWLGGWQRAAAGAEEAIDGVLSEEPALSGVHVGRAVWSSSSRSGGQLVLGSSNPIRDVDLAGQPQPSGAVSVYANRGLAGIDGTVATATGIALGRPGTPTRLLLGDLTLLHDAGGLLIGTGEVVPDLQIVVFNDAGGGIFFLLEHGQLGESSRYRASVERLFGTPHQVDLAALARAYGLTHQLIEDTGQLETALAEPISGRSILEVRGKRSGLRGLHQRLRDAVLAATAREQTPVP